MHELGMSVKDVIVSATRTPAEAFGVADRTGTIEPGKWADLTLIEGDPEQDLEAFRRVRAVYKGGRRVYWNENGEDHFLPVL